MRRRWHAVRPKAETAMHRCPVCEQPFVSHGPTEQTCKGYLSPPGHDHDDNRVVRRYRCGAGHVTSVRLRRRCGVPGCAWVSRQEGGEEEWPPLG